MIPLRAASIKDENAGGIDPWCQGADALVHPERSNIKGEDVRRQYLSLNIPGEFFIQILSICTWKIRIRLREKIVKNWYKRWTFFSSHNH